MTMFDPTPEQIEAAAKALRDDKANRIDTWPVPAWDDTPHGDKIVFRSQAKAALEAALAVAPQPVQVDEEGLERAARELNRFGWTCHGGTHEPGDYDTCEDCQTVCLEVARSAFHEMSGTPHLSADQVWAIAKAEHDYANDRDNVPAFVMPLVDGLRAAGVPFDEQPFIGSGYLLPAERGDGEPEPEWQCSYVEKWVDGSGVKTRVTFKTEADAEAWLKGEAQDVADWNAELPAEKIVASIERRRVLEPGEWQPVERGDGQ